MRMQYAEQDGDAAQTRLNGADALYNLRQDVMADLVAANALDDPDKGQQHDADKVAALRLKQLQIISKARDRLVLTRSAFFHPPKVTSS